MPLSDFFSIEDKLDNGFKRFNVVIPKSDNFLENITNIYNYSLVIPSTNVRKITPDISQNATQIYMTYFIDYLKKYMEKNQISLQKFCETTGISRSYLHKIFNFKNLPTLELVAKICHSYSIYLPDLFRVPEKQQLSIPSNYIRLNIILPISIEAMKITSEKYTI